ncbi:hypothetical protein WDW37_11725, partial [Bdellovibrionota bacterium FG-1]
KGNEKGRVEDGVKYIRLSFWHNRNFKNFEDLCNQASQWRDDTANLREHKTTKKIPRLVFEHQEKAHLQKANVEPYETDEVFSEKVRPDFHVIYETNQYSVPWTLVGCVITVRVDATEIRVYYDGHFVTRHDRCYLKHQNPFTKPEHEQGLKERKPQGKNAHIHWQIETLESYGAPLKQYLKCLRHSQRSLRHEVSQLLALGTVYGEKVLADTVETLLKLGTIGTDQIELALKRRERNEGDVMRPAPMSLRDNRLTRIPARVELSQYDQLLMTSRTPQSEPGALEATPTGAQQEKNENGKDNLNKIPDGSATADSDNTG